jgi:hypothetical protein
MTIVRVEDCRALRYCMKGVRRYFARHELDFNAFLHDGLDESAFPTDDYFAQQVIAQAKIRESD